MNYYIDVDGVLLTKDLKPALGAVNFIQSLLAKGSVFWLTTHCRDGKTAAVLQHLKPYFTSEELDIFAQVKPVVWNTLKTEAIEFQEAFLWFDDSPLSVELTKLVEVGKLGSFVRINLARNPQQLTDILPSL